jgi:hypothetical protein
VTPRLEVVDLGAAAEIAGIVAEYAGEDDAIRVSARAAGRIRVALGEAAAQHFIACAVAHERHHRAHPHAAESAAHAAAETAASVDPRIFEAVLREPRA